VLKKSLDVRASYPTTEQVMNVSKETTSKEIISIQGIEENIQRNQTINWAAGRSNAAEIANQLFSLPTLDEMLAAFVAHG
jgi:predicted ATP-grasp superfamily ATP-dependent carboligase